MNSSGNKCPTCFTAGAEMMAWHLGKFAEWAAKTGWEYYAIRQIWINRKESDLRYATSELLTEYFSQLNKLP